VANGLLSVSVLAAEAAHADAWATALLVLGPEQGAAVAEREGLTVHFVRERDGRLEATTTGAFEARLLR
jgi:thiamine biosynthesis lipoprotein